MGKKIDVINQNDNVSFSIVTKADIISDTLDCEWTCDYVSVCGRGYTKIIEDKEKKICALDVIMKNYSDKQDFSYPTNMIDRVKIIRINIIEINGKASNIKANEANN